MEYDNDYNSKYTNLVDQNYTRLKKDERKVKNDTDANPPQGGWGIGSKEPIRKDFSFYQKKLQYLQTEINPLGPYME